MTRTLVTGASGLIGSHLGRALAGHEAHALGRSDPGASYRWIRGDLAQSLDLATLPRAIDSVVYLAQSEHFRAVSDHASELFQVNVANVTRLAHWAFEVGARRFVLASSGGLYAPAARPLREDDAVKPEGELVYYFATKRCAELIAQAYAPRMTIAVLRFFFVYGPKQRRSMLIPRLVDSVREGRPIDLQGENGLRINPIHGDDAAAAVVAALELEDSAVINVAGPQALCLREIGEVIGAAVGKAPVFKRDDSREPAHRVADTSRMQALLGSPRIGLAEGIATMVGGG